MGDENQYRQSGYPRPGWYRDSNGIARIGEKPKAFKGRTAPGWAVMGNEGGKFK